MSNNDYQTFMFPDNFRFKVKKNAEKKKLSDEVSQIVEAVWQKESEKRDLFNGQILSLLEYQIKELWVESVDYKLYLAQVKKPILKKLFQIKPLSISCKTSCDNAILVGQRSRSVLQYPLWYELAPSGSLDAHFINGGELDVLGQALKELQEETGLSKESVTRAFSPGMIYDRRNEIYEIFVNLEIEAGKRKEALPASGEYCHLAWIPREDLSNFIEQHRKRLVPLSLQILSFEKNISSN